MKRIAITHKATGLQITALFEDSENLHKMLPGLLTASGLALANPKDWNGKTRPLWPQKSPPQD